MTILIKKYKNRRLYDTEQSRYITFENLKDYVLQEKKFQVQDASTGQDLTNCSLLQILLEMENGSTRFLSEDILRYLIRFAHHPMQQFINNMLEKTFSNIEMQGTQNPWIKGLDDWNRYMEILNTTFKNNQKS